MSIKSSQISATILRAGSAALLTGLLATACTQDATSEGGLEQIQDQLFLKFDSGRSAWPAAVNVCFDSTDGNNSALLGQAQGILAATWSRASNLSFQGWGACPTSGSFRGMRLHFCGGSSTSSNCPAAFYDSGVRSVGAFRGVTSGIGAPAACTGSGCTPKFSEVALISDDTQS
ncbi:MAG TPA: hypothetical protein VEQ59_25460, partial [Polyangiaceae bacterium]|nr:hypothetical protein [Polyangiaceae bacterium]